MAVDHGRRDELLTLYKQMSSPTRPIHNISNARMPNSASPFDGDSFVAFAVEDSERRAEGLRDVVDGLKKG